MNPDTLWHPRAKKVIGNDASTFTGGGFKLCLHSTEGASVDGAISAYRANNSWPHFTLGYDRATRKRILIQHIPLNRAARSLKHTLGPETNRANVIQVEIVGFAKDAAKWPPELYRYIHLLLLWLHRHCDIPMEAHHPFIGQHGYHRLSPTGWVKASGVVGHCHCPGNDHVDPGNINVGKVLG